MAPNLVEYVIHCKKKLDKNPDDDDIILNVIRKLLKIPMTVEILEATHIGKSIRNLSKRRDIVGENAKTVLNKWRNIFVSMESSKNSKEKKSVSNSDNVEKSSGKQYLIKIKSTHHHEKKSSLEQKEEKHKKNSSHHSSPKQSFEKVHNLNSSCKSSQSLEKSEMKSHLNDDHFQHFMEASSPDSQETFFLDDRKKMSSSSDAHATSSLKRKLTTEEKLETDMNSHPKKRMLEKHLSHSSEEKKCRIPVNKDESFSRNLKKEKSLSSHSKKDKQDNSKVKKVAEAEKSKPEVKVQCADGFTSSNVTFEDCLGFNDIVAVKKKKTSKPQSSTKKLLSDPVQAKNRVTDKKVVGNSPNKKAVNKTNSSKKSSHSSKEKLSSSVKKKSTLFDASKANSSSLCAMQPNVASPNQNWSNPKKENSTNEDVIKFTSSRKEKTAVYSGRKSFSRGVPSLAQCCYHILIENINILGPMGDTPYTLLKPILEKCTPNQLFTIEKFNPHLLYDTNELWEIHCKRDYKLLSPLEHETWRDVYLRGFDDREKKLKNITANIYASMTKAVPVRQLKLAFIDSCVKPPREVLRKQAKHRLLESGANIVKPEVPPTVNIKKIKIESTPCSSASSESLVVDKIDVVKTNESQQIETPNILSSPKGTKKPITPVVDPTASDKDFAALSLAAKKPKVAPLMAKTLKAMKQCFRR